MNCVHTVYINLQIPQFQVAAGLCLHMSPGPRAPGPPGPRPPVTPPAYQPAAIRVKMSDRVSPRLPAGSDTWARLMQSSRK